MQKILLIGSGGSGKSTLARELGMRLGIDVYHLDALLWKPNWTPATRQEQISIQSELMERDSWIIDGNYGGRSICESMLPTRLYFSTCRVPSARIVS